MDKTLHIDAINSMQLIEIITSEISDVSLIAQEFTDLSIFLIIQERIEPLRIKMQPEYKSSIKVTILGHYFNEQQVSIITHQIHTATNSKSSCMVRVALHDASQLHFSGMVKIDHKARLSEANQQSRFLLIGEKVMAQACPQLEINTHEVQCTHGSALSVISPDHFLLCASRGIAKNPAQYLIIRGFFSEELAEVSTSDQQLILNSLNIISGSSDV